MRRQNIKDTIIYGLFDTPAQVEEVYRALLDRGISIDDISLLMNEDIHERDFQALEATRTKEGVAAGSMLGGTLGGVLGGLVSLGSAISGIGLVIVGPALAFAAAGGLIGGLVGHGIPEDEAKHLHDELRNGKAMIAVHLREAKQINLARELMSALQGETIEMRA